MTSTAALRRMLATCVFTRGYSWSRPVIREAVLRTGKPEFKSRALARRALTLDRCFMLANDAVGNRQPQAGALTHRFRREERVVNAREVFRRDTVTGIRYFSEGLFAVQPRCDCQPATARHRIARIQEQIQEHLLQLELESNHVHRRGTE